VERQILEAIPSHLAEVSVDLSALDYIDSAGLRVLFALGTRLKTLQIGLVFVPTDSSVRQMIDLAWQSSFHPLRAVVIAGASRPRDAGEPVACDPK
jgi:anti-anti-sigma factor